MKPRHGVGRAPDRPLIGFFAIAYGLAWGIWLIEVSLARATGLSTTDFVAAVEDGDFDTAGQTGATGWLLYLTTRVQDFSFTIAGLAMIVTTEGVAGLVTLKNRLLKFNVPPGCWLLALAPIALYGGAALTAAGGGRLTMDFDTVRTLLVSLQAGVLVSLFLRGAMGEEIGLRGFALPRLQRRTNPFRASLVLGVLWALWHLPALLTGNPITAVVVILLIIGLSFVFTWMFNLGGGSLVPPLVFHALQNWEEGFETILPSIVGSDWEILAVLGLLALSILAATRVARQASPPTARPSPTRQSPETTNRKGPSTMFMTSNLRTLLRANALFAATTGLAAVAATGPIATLIGVAEHRLVSATGAGLLVFAVILVIASGTRPSVLIGSGRLISVADVMWVVGSVAILLLADLPAGGNVTVAVIGAIVAGFAVLQLRATRLVDETVPNQVVEVSKVIDGAIEDVWSVVIDHEAYGQLAQNLSKVMPTGPDGPDLTRRCWDTRGRHWDEACVLWEEGRRFAVLVDTATEDYPYPLDHLRGEWAVRPVESDRTEVTIRFELRPNPGPVGSAFAAAMTTGAVPLLRHIITGWEKIVARTPSMAATAPTDTGPR
ncbi:MAG: CPBP family glutamic-type intramembrane protease [Acidimicrobiales bacterium]